MYDPVRRAAAAGDPGLKTASWTSVRSRLRRPKPDPGLELAGHDGVGWRLNVPPGRPGIHAEQAQGQAGAPGSHGGGYLEGQAHGRVHRHRQGDSFGPVDVVGREGGHGQSSTHLVAGGIRAAVPVATQTLVAQALGRHPRILIGRAYAAARRILPAYLYRHR